MQFSRFLLVSAVVVLASAMVSAQTETALLSGKISDQRGAAIVAAELTVTNIATNVSVRGTTNQLGLYVIPSLQPGHYRVTVSKEGFKTINLSDLILTVQDNVSRNFELPVGSVSESVTVVADSADVRTSPAVSTVVDQRLVQELPLNGRSFQTLFQVTPGIVIAPTSGGDQGQFSANGQRTNTNYFVVDGASANAGVGAVFDTGELLGGALPALSALGGTNTLVSTDAVQEFAVQTSSYAPEFGRTPGAQVAIVTRSGTNAFHGDAFNYLRNDVFDANDWFANHAGLKRAELRQNDFGGVFGGPLLRNKSFFFLSYEGLRLRQPVTGQSDVPTVTSRSAAPASMQALFNSYPLPTGDDEGNGLAPAVYGFSDPSSLDAASLRIDHHFSQSVSIFGRYNYAPSDTQFRGGNRALNTVTETKEKLQTLTLGVNVAIRANLTEEGRFNWTRSKGESLFQQDALGGATPLSSASFLPASCLPSSCTFTAILSLAARNPITEVGENVGNVQRQTNFVDSIGWQIGAHLLKVGFDYRRLTPDFNPATYLQAADFFTIQSALTSQVDLGQIQARARTRAIFDNYSVFVEDSWRVTSRLNLVYGLRWDYNPAPSGRGSNGLTAFGVEGIPDLQAVSLTAPGRPLYDATLDNFAPRFGFTYKLRGSATTESIIRAGGGTFYDLGNGPAGSAFESFPFISQKNVFGAAFPFDSGTAAPTPITVTPPFSTITAFPRTLRLPYTYQWNLSLEQSLGSRQTVTVGYIGAIGHGLLRLNQYVNGTLPPDFTIVNYVDNGGYSKYNALQVEFRRSATRGLDIIGSYALAHSLDNVSSEVNPGIPGQFLNANIDYASSSFDIRHSGSIAIDYNLPRPCHSWCGRLLGGWSVDPIVIARSSPPVDVTMFRNIGFGQYSFRPDLIGGLPLYVETSLLPGGREINQAVLSVPAEQRQGDLGRNFFRGFPLVQADVAVRRRFKLTEKISVEARVDAFNVFNHPNFTPEAGLLGTVSGTGQLIPQNGFGVSPSMFGTGLQGSGFGSGFNPLYQIGGPRSLQLSLKLQF